MVNGLEIARRVEAHRGVHALATAWQRMSETEP
jgi:hypothetical protein